jgi:hypothetical protein
MKVRFTQIHAKLFSAIEEANATFGIFPAKGVDLAEHVELYK